MQQNFDAEMRLLLAEHRGEWRALSKGSGVSYSWIAKFVKGLIPNPGYNTLTKLHALLVPARKSRAVVAAKRPAVRIAPKAKTKARA